MPLFSQKPPLSASIVPTSQAPLSKDQKAFNILIKKIEAKRARLSYWDAAIPRFKQRYVSDLLPLQETEMKLQIQLAQALDLSYGQKGVTKGEKRKLSVIIVDLAGEALERQEQEELKALYNKYSQSDFDTEEAAHLEGVKSMLEEILGMDLGTDVDMRSPEDVLKQVEAQFRAQQDDGQAKAPQRKRSAKAQARQARLEAEEKQLSQSIREVYRKLASAFHPDREPDPAERQRKTKLMQRANDAYEKGNLLQLLELQLELENIDQTHLATIGPDRLKSYLKILKGQLSELDMEIQRVEDEFAAQFGLPPFQRLDPQDLTSMLQANVATCELGIRQLREHLDTAGDLKRLKAWLKTITLRRQTAPDFDFPF